VEYHANVKSSYRVQFSYHTNRHTAPAKLFPLPQYSRVLYCGCYSLHPTPPTSRGKPAETAVISPLLHACKTRVVSRAGAVQRHWRASVTAQSTAECLTRAIQWLAGSMRGRNPCVYESTAEAGRAAWRARPAVTSNEVWTCLHGAARRRAALSAAKKLSRRQVYGLAIVQPCTSPAWLHHAAGCYVATTGAQQCRHCPLISDVPLSSSTPFHWRTTILNVSSSTDVFCSISLLPLLWNYIIIVVVLIDTTGISTLHLLLG